MKLKLSGVFYGTWTAPAPELSACPVIECLKVIEKMLFLPGLHANVQRAKGDSKRTHSCLFHPFVGMSFGKSWQWCSYPMPICKTQCICTLGIEGKAVLISAQHLFYCPTGTHWDWCKIKDHCTSEQLTEMTIHLNFLAVIHPLIT